jgi:subtilase family serine protease
VRSLLHLTGLTALTVALAACGANGGSVPSSGGGAVAPAALRGSAYAYTLQPDVARACPTTSKPGVAECQALIRTDIRGGASPNVAGYGPSTLQAAYNLPSTSAGSGQVVAVVDAYDDPNAESDLATYRSEFGLPACNTSNPCFEKVNEEGQQSNYPAANSGWAVEESLDVDMVSAICPNCTVILVEANSNYLKDLGKSVDTAAKILKANVVSNSYIGYGGEGPAGGRYYHHPGHIITAAGGDNGYGVGEPAGFPSVVAVGGTSLRTATGSRGYTETAWSGTGSGCMKSRPKPTWQKHHGCQGRIMNDVAAVADPDTGVAVYDSYDESGWIILGGTSVASPIIASVYALAGNAGSENYAESLYAKGASLYDVTAGDNGHCHHPFLCEAMPGYDGPTGMGTPNGVSAF